MNSTLKISIVTATFNCVDFVQTCLDSVASQSYKHIEHILIDGDSSDGTKELLRSKQCNSCTVLIEPDTGIYDAMNKGIELASGDVVGFLNSDDFYVDDFVIEKVAEIFSNNDSLGICYANLEYVSRYDSSNVVRFWKSEKFQPGFFSKGWCPPHPTFFVRRSLFEAHGRYDLNFRIAADVDLMMRFTEVFNIESRYVDDLWVRMRLGGTTNKSIKNIVIQNLEVISALKKYKLYVNLPRFIFGKVFSRCAQFVKKD